MPRISKIIIGVLLLIVIIVFFGFLSANSQKNALQKDKDKLKSENSSLQKRVEEGKNEVKKMNDRLSSLEKDLARATSDKDNIQKRLDQTNQEKSQLAQKLANLSQQLEKKEDKPASAAAPAVAAAVTPQSEAYWAGVIKAKTDLELKLETARGELRTVNIKNDQLAKEKNELELEISNLGRQIQDLKRQYDYNQKVTDSLTQEFVREQNDKVQIQGSVLTLREENVLLRRQLKSVSAFKLNLERKLADLQAKNAKLENSFDKIEVLLRDKVTQMDSLKKQLELTVGEELSSAPKPETPKAEERPVELPPIIVRPQQQIEPAAPIAPTGDSGKVILVNRDNNFVIVNRGEDAGARVGDKYQIVRDGRVIATIEAIQIRRNISACDIKTEVTPVKVGDAVR